MNKKKLIFIFALIFLFGVVVIKVFDKDRGFLANLIVKLIPFTLIEESTSIVHPCSLMEEKNWLYDSCHIETMESFVDNLTNGNVKEVVAQIEFPLTFYANGNQIIVLDAPDHFIDKYYHYVFPKHIIKDLQTEFEEDRENLGGTEYPGYGRGIELGNKEMSFGGGDFLFNMESGKVITINNTDEILIQKMIDEDEEHGFRIYPISLDKEGANSQDNIGQMINGKWRSGTIRSSGYCGNNDFNEMGPYTVLIDIPKIVITEDGTPSRTPYKWECRVKKTYKTSLEEASNAENADWGTCGGSWDNLNYFDSISVMELENSSKDRKWIRKYEDDFEYLDCKNIVVSNNGRRISLLLGTFKLTSEQSLPRQGFVLKRR